ncbi:DUF397 domain-containing protein [Streptomyces sp. NBC_00338]|uniref:DUF397 domain-containing protein n=1 Tax=Streptomyces sp. NBC_00338 TaxID=2975715 RepID=UPI002258E521|nr:DUF397 domain-containing protein [Streptomyces sp. NBC_00338]MCX5140493.1 DUF397 domain-containing protein [Streptomyces sp. NBC_00338]
MRKTNTEVPESAWFKSSYSGGNETECVEAAFTSAGASVRDSKQPRNGLINVQSAVWDDFISSLRSESLS